MRDIIERFTGRYQIWRDEQRAERSGPEKNPHAVFAWVAAAFLAWDIYKLATAHYLSWRSISVDALFIVFLILCVWRPRVAWVMFLVCGATMVIESPWVYMLAPYRYPARIRLFSALLFAAMGLAAFGYGFIIRRRYEAYCAHRDQTRDDKRI